MKIPIDPSSLAPLIAGIIKFWTRSIRFELHGNVEIIKQLQEGGAPLVLALWHGELFPAISFGFTVAPRVVTFVSQSKDGEFIARVIERLGHVTVRGSSTRGGLKALLQAKRIMQRDQRSAVFTVDGPRGPRHKAKNGVIFLAQHAGAKILPIRAYPRKASIFNSWDKFILPWPFTHCPIYIGDPMEVTDEKLNKDVLAKETERLEKILENLGPQ